ncbi:MAG TPA: cytochrome c [Thauera sp.]|uniref:c-type cytochrome n=1 Tax=Thauera sp. TaxID=1905334 RepID=UPI002C5B401B|nr:cytochrome c [Thauera sp.]HRP26716.1 cytochrome c [Thauera sp.]HRP67614.1 cytochrome c [Thauera sp.]
MKKSILLGALALSIATTAAAQVKPEDQIKFRQAGYSFMSWNMGKIKANVEGEFNAQQVEAAANAIAAIAASGMGALYGPGTEKDIGNVKTRVKPEFFQNMEDVGKLATDFNAAAANLAKVAASGDKAAVQQAFGETGATCKACHDKYRMD